jgi:hypothetical protein
MLLGCCAPPPPYLYISKGWRTVFLYSVPCSQLFFDYETAGSLLTVNIDIAGEFGIPNASTHAIQGNAAITYNLPMEIQSSANLMNFACRNVVEAESTSLTPIAEQLPHFSSSLLESPA